LIGIGVDYILTSGGSQTAEDGFEVISELAKRALGRIVIMAGSGINPSNATLIAGTGVNDLHFTCRKSVQSSMSHKNFALGSMGSATGLTEYEIEIFDHDKFNGIRDALSRL
jgi:copper homeostasis protein